MKIRALVSFSGAISMGKGQELECNDQVVLQDLLRAGFVEEVHGKSKKGVKTNESK